MTTPPRRPSFDDDLGPDFRTDEAGWGTGTVTVLGDNEGEGFRRDI
ncbi:MAG: hypothetical protein ACRD6N_12875 [Pyrinomonadaceae bacterium]